MLLLAIGPLLCLADVFHRSFLGVSKRQHLLFTPVDVFRGISTLPRKLNALNTILLRCDVMGRPFFNFDIHVVSQATGSLRKHLG